MSQLADRHRSLIVPSHPNIRILMRFGDAETVLRAA